MKVLAINGSARKDGNTAILINIVLEELKKQGIETEMIQLAGKHIQGCTACRKCFENQDRKCVFGDKDGVNEIIAKMCEADGIILGSPTYFCNTSPEIAALMHRSGYVALANGALFKRKVGAAVAAVRRAGSIHVFNSINHLFTINQMIIVGSSYWNMGIGLNIGDVESDEEGIRTMKTLGQNMGWLLKKISQ